MSIKKRGRRAVPKEFKRIPVCISMSPEIHNVISKKTYNISSYIENLIVKDLSVIE